MADEPCRWMIYGVTGYTGKLVVQEAVARGHRPIIAGRNAEKLKPMAEEYQLEYMAIDLTDSATLRAAVEDVDLVFHVAGPYVVTAEPMIQACLAGKTHYVDITGEAAVFRRIFELSEQARAAGICLVSGIGFDVIPTDCLLAYVAAQVDHAESLELAILPTMKPSAGTAKSALGIMKSGRVEIRKNGEITSVAMGSEIKTVNFPSGARTVTIAPIADVYTAHYSTGARNIKTFIASPRAAAHLSRFAAPLLRRALSSDWVMKRLERTIEKKVQGPDADYQEVGRAEIWARAENAHGDNCEAYLTTGEVYLLTAQLSLRFIEKVLANKPEGTLAPAQLFPMSELLGVDQVKLFNSDLQPIHLSPEVSAIPAG